jgi:hypothetical protein
MHIAALSMAGACFVMGGCVSLDYSSLPPGSFDGEVLVMWVGEGERYGDGRFLFVPHPDRPLIFQRADGREPGAEIMPGIMFTDGGSIPKIGQLFAGFNPWGYAPAYMIHDWMFVAHHCIVDGQDSPLYDDVRDVTFDSSAEILGEGIRGLVHEGRVKQNDLAGSVITSAVHGGIARGLWNKQGACEAEKVPASYIAAVAASFPARAADEIAATARMRPDEMPAVRIKPAEVIARVRF